MLPEEDRENQQKKDVSVTQSCLGGLLPGTFLTLRQEAKLPRRCDWVSPSWSRRVLQSLGRDCCHGVLFLLLGMGEGSGAGAVELTLPRVHPCVCLCVWNTRSFRLRYFPTSAEKSERKSRTAATRCGIPASVLEKKAQEGVREPGKMSEVIFVLIFFLMQSQFGSSGCVFGLGLVLKKGCRKFLQRRRSWITGKSVQYTLWGMKFGDPQCRKTCGGDVFW